MPNSDISIRFTDENYATRNDVAKVLGTNLIDPLWNNILKYRSTMQKRLEIIDILHRPYTITLTSKINKKISLISELNLRYVDELSKLTNGGALKETIIENQLIQVLKGIAKYNNIPFADNELRSIVNNRSYKLEQKFLTNYIKALDALVVSYEEEVSEDLLAKFLSILKDQSELTSFYRLDEIKSESSMYLVSKEYEAAPTHEIESLMQILIKLINNKEEDLLTKIVATLYMFEYIKPFDEFNREMSFIIVKKLLAQSGSKENAIFIPLENILLDAKFYSLSLKETKKTNDLTYELIVCEEILEKELSSLIDRIIQSNGQELQQSYYVKEDTNEVKDRDENNQQIVENENVKETVKNEANPSFISKHIEKKQELTEKEYKERTAAMLQENPYIKKSQAHFYVRHCKIGQYYTIQEFKKCEHVVYETARTSMDNLAAQGYYKKEQIKNKFVYTPIAK